MGRPDDHDLFRMVRGHALQRHARAAHLGYHGAALRHRRGSAGAGRPAQRVAASSEGLECWVLVRRFSGARPSSSSWRSDLKLTSAAEAASIAPTLMPVFAGVFGWAFLRAARMGALARLLCHRLRPVSLVIAGTAGHMEPPSVVGLGALATAAALWAVYTLLFRRSGLTPSSLPRSSASGPPSFSCRSISSSASAVSVTRRPARSRFKRAIRVC